MMHRLAAAWWAFWDGLMDIAGDLLELAADVLEDFLDW